MIASQALADTGDARLMTVAREARQAIEMIDWFYVRNGACPQPTRPADLEEMQSGLGDGYSVEPQGRFVAIRGISMVSGWLYYTSPKHADQCMLWRKLDWDAALIWRRHGGSTEWGLDPGDGGTERRLRLRFCAGTGCDSAVSP